MGQQSSLSYFLKSTVTDTKLDWQPLSISVAVCCLHLREKPLNCYGHSFPPENLLWVLLESGSSTGSPRGGSSDLVYDGVPVFHAAHIIVRTIEGDPNIHSCLCFSLLMNRIRLCSWDLFFKVTLLNNLRGILTCYYPLTQRWY